jgi:DNA invertase Pin-like site-specific DNA recombinase
LDQEGPLATRRMTKIDESVLLGSARGRRDASPQSRTRQTRQKGRREARSTRDLLNVLDAIAKAGAGFRSIADAWADTTTAHGRLMLIVLGGLAEFERELIKARTSEGRKRAQARGLKFGRKPKLSAFQIKEALARREAGEPLVEIGRSYNVSHSTISRL